MLATATVGMTSCDTSTESEHHETAFLPLNVQGRVLYADQAADTLGIYSFDSWKLAVATTEAAAWITASPTQQTVPAASVATTPVILTTTPNTTGKSRTATLQLTTTFPDFGTLTMGVRQLPWLDVRRPVNVPAYTAEGVATPSFTETLTHDAGSTTLSIFFHDKDAGTHSVISKADWISLPEVPQDGYPYGLHTIKLTLRNNTAKTARTGEVVITSAGVSTILTYTQQGQP